MIDILLSTFNGEKYLNEQIDSILNQTYKDFRLLIRDDGSIDQTISIIEYYCKLYPLKVINVENKEGNIGSTQSFESLLNISTNEYIMFCDQDDVWLPDKIDITYKEIKKIETQFPKSPLLVYTDLKVVDQNLNIISESFIKSHRLFSFQSPNYYEMVALSVVAGCTMMINRTAKKYILPIPFFLIHDHWIATNIAYYGKCYFVNNATILYRQHINNSIGYKHVDFKYLLRRFLKIAYLITLWRRELSVYSFKISITRFLYYKIKFNFFRMFDLFD